MYKLIEFFFLDCSKESMVEERTVHRLILDDEVRFVCVKDKGKLRIRVISSGYNSAANCQFPRAIRRENAMYKASRSALSFASGSGGTFFYRVKASSVVEIPSTEAGNIKVYDVSDDPECVICLDGIKTLVFIPCGHFCVCDICYNSLKKKDCPMCRAHINQAVDRSLVET